MTNSDPSFTMQEVHDAASIISSAIDAAIAYKEMFHAIQQDFHDMEDKYFEARALSRQQREIIRKLERRLNIDDEL